MKKRYVILVTILMLMLMVCGCAKGNVRDVDRTVGDSDIYSSAAIRKAMDVVMSHFEREFSGCTLLKLEYDEDFSLKHSTELAEQYGTDEVIVLLSSFRTGENGGKGNLNPDYTYERYQWVLTRSFWGGWKIQDCGYA